MITVICGGDLYDVSIVFGVFDNRPKESDIASILRRLLGSKDYRGGFAIVDNTMDILISAKNYYYENINVLKFNKKGKLDVEKLINIILRCGLV